MITVLYVFQAILHSFHFNDTLLLILELYIKFTWISEKKGQIKIAQVKEMANGMINDFHDKFVCGYHSQRSYFIYVDITEQYF